MSQYTKAHTESGLLNVLNALHSLKIVTTAVVDDVDAALASQKHTARNEEFLKHRLDTLQAYIESARAALPGGE